MLVAKVCCHSSVADLLYRVERVLVGRIVDEDVDPPERLHGFGDKRAAVPGIGDVAGEEDGLAPGLTDQAGRILRVRVFAKVADEDVGALACIGDRDGTADAAVSSGNHCFLVLQPTGALVAFLAMIGPRRHGVDRAGHRLRLVREGRLRIFAGHQWLRDWEPGQPGPAGLVPVQPFPFSFFLPRLA
jgi:hypothetical protein